MGVRSTSPTKVDPRGTRAVHCVGARSMPALPFAVHNVGSAHSGMQLCPWAYEVRYDEHVYMVSGAKHQRAIQCFFAAVHYSFVPLYSFFNGNLRCNELFYPLFLMFSLLVFAGDGGQKKREK